MISINVAIFFDENGDYLGKQRFNCNKDTFEFQDRQFNVKRKNVSYFRRVIPPVPIIDFITIDYYFYNFDMPEPYYLQSKTINKIDPRVYNLAMKVNIGRSMQSLFNKGFQFNKQHLFMLLGSLVVLALLWGVLSGQIKF